MSGTIHGVSGQVISDIKKKPPTIADSALKLSPRRVMPEEMVKAILPVASRRGWLPREPRYRQTYTIAIVYRPAGMVRLEEYSPEISGSVVASTPIPTGSQTTTT